MRTARFIIDQDCLMEKLGFHLFNGNIEAINIFKESFTGESYITFYVSGNDDKLPNKDNYPDCYIIAEKTVSKLEEKEEEPK
jgi:hypothetical protein